MRRVLAVAAIGAALVGWVPASPASADHRCDEAIEIVCFLTCPSPKICPWP